LERGLSQAAAARTQTIVGVFFELLSAREPAASWDISRSETISKCQKITKLFVIETGGRLVIEQL